MPDVVMITRGCVLKMYHCGLKMEELKNIFWEAGDFSVDPVASNRTLTVCDECVSCLFAPCDFGCAHRI